MLIHPGPVIQVMIYCTLCRVRAVGPLILSPCLWSPMGVAGDEYLPLDIRLAR